MFRRRPRSEQPDAKNRDIVDASPSHSAPVTGWRHLVNSRRTIDEAIEALLEAMQEKIDSIDSQPVQEPAPELPAGDTVDHEFARCLALFLRDPAITPVNGEIGTVRILGMLRDRSMAWVSEESRACGRIAERDWHAFAPGPDDILTVRFVSHPWGCDTIAVVPGSLVRANERHLPIPPTQAPAPTYVPERARGTWKASLEPGDIVLARVPYDGHNPTDRQRRISKRRPAIFRGWERDWALLHPVYDAKGYVGSNGLGLPLIDTHKLDKNSVARRTPYDIDVDSIGRLIARLGPRDLKTLGLDAPHTPAAAPPDTASPKAETPKQTTESPVDAEGAVNLAPITDQRQREPWKEVIAEIPALIGTRAGRNSTELLADIISVLVDDVTTFAQLTTEGIPYSNIGYIHKTLVDLNQVEQTSETLSERLALALDSVAPPPGHRFARSIDAHNLPVLRLLIGSSDPDLTGPQPIDRSANGPFDPKVDDIVELSLPDDYTAPDLVIMDQSSTRRMLGNARIDFAATRKLLTCDSDVPCVLIAEYGDGPIATLHHAARQRGWIVRTAENGGRDEVCETACEMLREHGASLVTVVSVYQDIARDLENLGAEIQEVSSVERRRG